MTRITTNQCTRTSGMGKLFNQIKTNFTVIPNKFIAEKNLSAMARIVFIYMLSKPEDWLFNRDIVCSDLAVSKETLKKYIDELVESGWVTRLGQQNESGKFGGVEYVLNNILEDEDVIVQNPGTKLYNYKKEQEIKEPKQKEDWRTNFDLYKSMVDEAVEKLSNDNEFEAIYTNWFPNVDFAKTVDKTSFFWKSEAGWKNKKSKRTGGIDLVATLKNGLDRNRVYKSITDRGIESKISNMDSQLELFNKARGLK